MGAVFIVFFGGGGRENSEFLSVAKGDRIRIKRSLKLDSACSPALWQIFFGIKGADDNPRETLHVCRILLGANVSVWFPA